MGAESLSTGLPNRTVIERDANGDLTEGDPDPGVPGPTCFTSGTYLDTPSGPRLIEILAIDDEVLTLDGGAMPIRWIGCRRGKANGKFAPVVIPANLLGQHQAIRVSQLHRILVRDTMAMLLFGQFDFLISAKDLVGIEGVYLDDQELSEVAYYYVLLDGHQIVTGMDCRQRRCIWVTVPWNGLIPSQLPKSAHFSPNY